MPLPALAPDHATKHAVIGLTETLNIELRSVSERLGVTVLCPGLVDTAVGSNSYALVPPGAVAAIAAIEAGRVHAVVGPYTDVVVRQRLDVLLAALN